MCLFESALGFTAGLPPLLSVSTSFLSVSTSFLSVWAVGFRSGRILSFPRHAYAIYKFLGVMRWLVDRIFESGMLPLGRWRPA